MGHRWKRQHDCIGDHGEQPRERGVPIFIVLTCVRKFCECREDPGNQSQQPEPTRKSSVVKSSAHGRRFYRNQISQTDDVPDGHKYVQPKTIEPLIEFVVVGAGRRNKHAEEESYGKPHPPLQNSVEYKQPPKLASSRSPVKLGGLPKAVSDRLNWSKR